MRAREFTHDAECRQNLCKLSIQRGNLCQVAKELGISDSQLRKWRKDFDQYGSNSFPGRGIERMTNEQREIKRLQTELKDKELDIEILKNAIAFFSRADKLRNQLFAWIECWYNKTRRHSALGNLTITEFAGKQNKKTEFTNFPNLLCG